MTQQPQTTPEKDIDIARTALTNKDLPHAVHHIAWALQSDPQNPDALAVLDQIIAAAPDPAALVSLQSSMSTAEAAVLAYIRAHQGDYSAALQIIGQVNTALPDGRYLTWATEWLARPAARDVSLPMMIMVLVEMGKAYRGDVIDDMTVRSRVAAFVDAVAVYADGQKDAGFDLTYSLVLRKAGKFEEALKRGQSAYDEVPNAYALVAIAYAQRALGRHDESLATFQQAAELDPSYIEIQNDIGDMLANQGKISEAALAYGKVMDKEPNHHWAAPSYYFYQFELDSDPYWKNKLLSFTAANPDNARAAELAHAMSPDGLPFIDFLPEPSEALINLVKQVKEQSPELKGNFEIGLSSLEAPSAVLAVTRALSPDARPVIGIAKVQSPDPRRPQRTVAFHLWKYNGTEAAPALPPPPSSVADAVAKIAATPYSLTAWVESAKQVAAQVGEQNVEQLLSVMVNPPPTPDGISHWAWIQNVQVAAALAIAYIGKDWERPIPKKGWFGKSSEPAPRQAALHALLFGVMDWTVTAAIIALTHIALTEREREKEIAKWYSDVFFQMPKGGYVPYTYALGVCGLRLPSLSNIVKQRFQQMASLR